VYLECTVDVSLVSVKSHKPKRVQITLSPEQWKLVDRLRGEMGMSDAEVVRNILIAWLSEKSFISSSAKGRNR